MTVWSLRINEPMMADLMAHLYPGDHDEHGAVIGASVHKTDRGVRLLARRLFLAEDRVDYVAADRSHRRLKASFVANAVLECEAEGLAYFAIHNHGAGDHVEFSLVDMRSHERGYPALLDILDGQPVGGLVFASNAVAGDVWLPDRTRVELDRLDVVGRSARTLRPSPPLHPETADERYDRQTRLFGDRGQATLTSLKIGIVGLGGIGSLVNELVARLGVGEIIAIDPDRLELPNLPRVVDGRRRDCRPLLTHPRTPRIMRLVGERLRTPKVKIAKRVAKRANPTVKFTAVVGDVVDEQIAALLTDCDYLFLSADSAQARLVFNELVHQYLIPGVQLGAKVQASRRTGKITDVFSVRRQVVPGDGCLWCNGLISPSKLQEEAEGEEQRRRQRYVDDGDVHAPSVITLNAVAASHGVNEFLMTMLGLTEPGNLTWLMDHPLEPTVASVLPQQGTTCGECASRLGAGPLVALRTRPSA